MNLKRCILAFLFFLPLLVLADTNTVATLPDTAPTGSWSYLLYAVPVVAPMLVALMKFAAKQLELRINGAYLPYVCTGIGLVISLILDLGGRLNMSPWLYGPLAGALGIGARELLTKGSDLLQGKTTVTTPTATVAPSVEATKTTTTVS